MKITDKILERINHRSQKEFEPYYIYDTQKIRQQCQQFNSLDYPEKSIHFATMANNHPEFLRIIKEEGMRVFVNSLLHLDIVSQLGFEREEIIFTSSGLTENTMQKIAEFDVQLNLDSPMQLERWLKLFPDKKVGIRCNIGSTVSPFATHAGFFIGENSRLGFTESEIKNIPDKSKIRGLHLYAGTDIFDLNYFMNCYRELIRFADYFPELEYLNMGGGFGVAENGYEAFDFSEYNIRVTELMESISEKTKRRLKLILEPGRIIGGKAGYFVCCVTDIKQRENKRLIGVNGSTVQFSRPLLYPDIAKHPVVVLRNGIPLNESETVCSTVFGCSTYSRDIFRENVQLPVVEPGDTLVFCNAGSYSASTYLHFLGFPKPEELFV